MDLDVLLDSARHGEVHAHDRMAGALVDRDVASSDPVQRAQRVIGAMLHRYVAVDCGYGDEFEVLMQCREHNRHRIICSSIDIEYKFTWHSIHLRSDFLPLGDARFSARREGPRATCMSAAALRRSPNWPRWFGQIKDLC